MFEFKDYRNKKLLTVLGPVTLKRAYYFDQDCQKGYCPKDTALDIKETTFSFGIRRIMGRVGAPWIWNIADLQFYGAIQIIDIYHAREHYWKVAKIMFGRDKTKIKTWADKRRKELDCGDVEQVIAAIKRLSPHTEEDKAEIEKEIGYFDKNKDRMRYKTFRKQGLFIGSGVVEAGCRTVIGQRLKQSGMHWTVQGANKIIALRCCILSNRWEDFWEYRACA